MCDCQVWHRFENETATGKETSAICNTREFGKMCRLPYRRLGRLGGYGIEGLTSKSQSDWSAEAELDARGTLGLCNKTVRGQMKSRREKVWRRPTTVCAVERTRG